MKLVTVAEMQAVEREANANGLTYEMMMGNAGRGLAEVVSAAYSHLDAKSALGLIGSGNNGGDTLVALTHLAERGWRAAAYIVRERPGDDPLMTELKTAGGAVYLLTEDPGLDKLADLLAGYSVLLDGILGTGIKLPLRGKIVEVLEKSGRILARIETPPHVVAVDCPSGVDCDTGDAAPECLPAELTVTMAAAKVGLLQFPAFKYVGEIQMVGIGPLEDLKPWQEIRRFIPDAEWVRQRLPKRPMDSHKGTFGTALIVAGSVNFTGAALLSGQAAYRSGAGLVTLAIPYPLHSALAGQFPEATWLLLPHEIGVIAEEAADVLLENLQRPTAMLIGPGFGMEDTTRNFLSRLFYGSSRAGRGGIGFVRAPQAGANAESPSLPPIVLDADGLKLLSQLPDWAAHVPSPAVLTPHPGEMSVLTGLSKDEIQADRLGVAERFAREWKHIVVLKGAFTAIASPEGETAVIPVASPALARAGTGDVLAGLIAGLRAQGMDAFQAAVAGAWIHAHAGLRAAEALGNTASVLAGDVLQGLIDVFSDLE